MISFLLSSYYNFYFTSTDWEAHQFIINHKCLIYTVDCWMHFTAPEWPKEEYFALEICGAREIMEKAPAMRENESLPTLRGRWTSWGNQPVEWAIGPRFWKDWWGLMEDRHCLILISLLNTTNRHTNKNVSHFHSSTVQGQVQMI